MLYQEIKTEVLDAYFDFCRDRGWKQNFSHEQVLGSVSYEFENVFTEDEDKLKFCVVLMTLSGGWFPAATEAAKSWVLSLSSSQKLNKLFEELEEADSTLLKDDMRVLGLI